MERKNGTECLDRDLKLRKCLKEKSGVHLLPYMSEEGSSSERMNYACKTRALKRNTEITASGPRAHGLNEFKKRKLGRLVKTVGLRFPHRNNKS